MCYVIGINDVVYLVVLDADMVDAGKEVVKEKAEKQYADYLRGLARDGLKFSDVFHLWVREISIFGS